MALDDTIAILSRASLLGHFERDALRLLAFSAETRRLRDGDTLFRHGERSDGGYVVLAGEVVVAHPNGAETVAAVGAVVGRTALFLRSLRVGTALGRGRTELLRISPTLMRRVLTEFPAAAAAVRDALADDLSDFTGELQRVGAMLDRIDAPR